MTNDFALTLLKKLRIDVLATALKSSVGYFDVDEGLVVYPLPGGTLKQGYMDGSAEWELPFGIGIKTKSQENANATLWAVQEFLMDPTVVINSENDSYEYVGINTGTPALNDKDVEGYYVYTIDVNATLLI
jgi:hypothetical protein